MPNSSTIPTTGRTQATQTLYNNLVKDAVRLLSAAGSAKTISGGVITVTPSAGESHYTVGTEAAAAYDDLDTINGGATGDIVSLMAASASENVILRSGSGNIRLIENLPLVLNARYGVQLRYDGSYWMPTGGAGLMADQAPLTNQSGASMAAGDVIVFDTANDAAFKSTTVERDLRVMGVLRADTGNGVLGPVYTGHGKIVTVNCTSDAIARGQYLITSTTAGKAKALGYFRSAGAFAVAVTSKAGGATGTVRAMLLDNTDQAFSGTAGWAMGGGTTAVATTQKMTYATESWATIAGAALPGARTNACGLGYGTTASYASMGADSGASATNGNYKITYATEVSSSLSVGLQRDAFRSGINFSSKGFMAGGVLSSVNRTDIQKNTFATDTIATIAAVLTSARQSQGGVSDGTYAYIAGATAVTCDRVDNATETIAAAAAANLAAAASGYAMISFPASAGYRAMNDGSSNYTRKLTFATATDANNTSGPTGALDYAQYVTDGIAFGYLSNATRANKLDSSTGTYSSSTATSVTDRGANASYGAY